MSTVRIPACALKSVTPIVMPRGVTVVVDLDMTPKQRLTAVGELLGTGMSEQQAYEGLRSMFPGWFAETPLPEVSDSSFGEFETVRGGR